MSEPGFAITEPVTESRPHSSSPLPEIAISHWWRFADLSKPFTFTDGRSVSIVFRGVWTHGTGPDFREAMIAIGQTEIRSGSVEIHRNTSDWYHHGHDRDPAYNDVILHVVLHNDRTETRRADGAVVPVVVLPAGTIPPNEAAATGWSMVGGDVCAAHLVTTHRDALRAAVHDLGDRRLGSKSARLEAQLASRQPGEVLYSETMDGLGYSANREPMSTLASAVPLQTIEMLMSTIDPERRAHLAMAALLGVGGFLPLSPQIQEVGGLSSDDVSEIEALWHSHCSAWHDLTMPPTGWKLSRIRPANHPARRIVAAAAMVARADGGLLFNLIEAVRQDSSLDPLLTRWATWNGQRLLGEGRAGALAANAIVPFALALAAHSGDDDLAIAASRCWESLPGEEPNQVTRRAIRQIAGREALGSWGARGMQGLLQLDATLCAPRRCFECPIAQVVVSASQDPS